MKKYKIITITGDTYEVERSKVDFTDQWLSFPGHNDFGDIVMLKIPLYQIRRIEEIIV